MTRPFGKSPARSRVKSPQLDLKQVSLIDMGAEDDGLLTGKGMASPLGGSVNSFSRGSGVGTSPFKTSTLRTLACIREDLPETEASQSASVDGPQDVLPPLSTNEPALKKKKKKTGFNLRKSLAWNNAFFTEEGVLDPEELSLVNRTFKKEPEVPKPPSTKKPAFASKILNSSGISKINFSPVRFQKPPLYGETKHQTALPAQSSPLNNIGNTVRRTNQNNSGAKGFFGSKPSAGPPLSRARDDAVNHVNTSKLAVPFRADSQGLNKHMSMKKHIEESERIHKGQALPPAARSILKIPHNQPQQPPSLSNALSSASRMMKDRLGMVFAGHNAGNSKNGIKPTSEDDTGVPLHKNPEHSEGAKLARCYSHTAYERLGRSMATTSTGPSSHAIAGDAKALESKHSDLQGAFSRTVVPLVNERFEMSMVTTSTEPVNPAIIGVGTAKVATPSCISSSYSFPEQKLQTTGASFPHTLGLSTNCPQSRPLETSSSNTGASEPLLLRAKPSGLRMPSPKLGFFDKAKTSSAAQIAVLRERTNGFGHERVSSQSARYTADSSVDPRKHSSSSTCNIISQASKGASYHMNEGTGIKCPGKQISIEKPPIPFKILSQPQFKLGHGEMEPPHIPTTAQCQYSDNKFSKPEHSSASTKGSQTKNCLAEGYAPSKLPSDSLLTTNDSTLATTANDTKDILQVKKNVQNVLPTMKKIVNKLNLSPLRTTELENLPLENLQMKNLQDQWPVNEKSCSRSDFGVVCSNETQEKWPEEKSGAVQHSPPQKEPPKCGPWSPVRRNVPELGPFDCTKYSNPLTLH